MAPKRTLDGSEPGPEAKKPKHGFRVGPENLPDGPWRRKVTKIKRDLIHKAKVKKAYAKIKAREGKPAEAAIAKGDEPHAHDDDRLEQDDAKDGGDEEEQIHPTRQLMLKDEEMAQAGVDPEKTGGPSDGRRRRTRRPGYYDKQLQKADQRRTEAEEKRKQYERRMEERQKKTEERQRFKKAMAKTWDKDGKKKLGRESSLLLEKVKKLVGEQ